MLNVLWTIVAVLVAVVLGWLGITSLLAAIAGTVMFIHGDPAAGSTWMMALLTALVGAVLLLLLRLGVQTGSVARAVEGWVAGRLPGSDFVERLSFRFRSVLYQRKRPRPATKALAPRPGGGAVVLFRPGRLKPDAWLALLAQRLRPIIRRRSGLRVPAVTIKMVPADFLGTDAGRCTHPAPFKREYVRPIIEIADDAPGPLAFVQIVTHELLHAALTKGAGHGWAFQAACAKMGFDPKPPFRRTADFEAWATRVADAMPPLPLLPLPPSAVTPRRPAGSALPVRLPLMVAWAAICGGVWYVMLRFGATPDTLIPFAFIEAAGAVIGGYHIWFALADSGMARWPTARRLASVLLLLVPLGLAVAGILHFWRGMTLHYDGPMKYSSLPLLSRDGLLMFGFTVQLATIAAAFCFLPVMAGFYMHRPFARRWRWQGQGGETFPFLLRTRRLFAVDFRRHGHPGKPRRLSRSRPRDLARAMFLMERSAMHEKWRRGLAVCDEDGTLEPLPLLPDHGFVIDERPAPDGGRVAVVAYDIGGSAVGADRFKSGAGVNAPGFSAWMPIMSVLTKPIRLAPAAGGTPFDPPSTERGGAGFHWPFGAS